MFKKSLLIFACLVLFVVTLGGAGVAYLYLRKPAQAPPSAIKVAVTVGHIARGRYIFDSVADCGGCHSQRDFSLVGGPAVDAGRGAGSVLSDFMKGLPGTVVAPNITPDPDTGIGAWSDGEKIRAIRDGIDRDGNPLFPMMPYEGFRHMSDEDVEAVVAYLNSLPPVKHAMPKTALAFPVSLFIRSVPKPAGSVPPPDRANRVKFGEYLVSLGGCRDCHTPTDKGQPLSGKDFAGGQIFDTRVGKVVSANITPDLDTGIGKWSEEFFLKKFYDYKEYVDQGCPKLSGPEAFTLMPWLGFSQKSPEDLGAIYTYLQSLPPVHNSVETHPGFPKKAPAVP
jgi:mono/diheme cytochrome c family protein